MEARNTGTPDWRRVRASSSDRVVFPAASIPSIATRSVLLMRPSSNERRETTKYLDSGITLRHHGPQPTILRLATGKHPAPCAPIAWWCTATPPASVGRRDMAPSATRSSLPRNPSATQACHGRPGGSHRGEHTNGRTPGFVVAALPGRGLPRAPWLAGRSVNCNAIPGRSARGEDQPGHGDSRGTLCPWGDRSSGTRDAPGSPPGCGTDLRAWLRGKDLRQPQEEHVAQARCDPHTRRRHRPRDHGRDDAASWKRPVSTSSGRSSRRALR